MTANRAGNLQLLKGCKLASLILTLSAQIAGGAASMSSMWGQMVALAGANISLTVLSSAPLGTQAQELTGDPAFILNNTGTPTSASQRLACGYWKEPSCGTDEQLELGQVA